MRVEQRLFELGIELPRVPAPAGKYASCSASGNLLFLSGQGPLLADGFFARGKVGSEISLSEGRERARLAGLLLIAVLRDTVGNLDRVMQINKLFGMVNAVPDFAEHPAVIDGCSDLFLSVFGESGRHARSSVGVASLPGDISVEVEAVVTIER
ncbi:RidA family protein [Mesorhizobium shangrilense]|uniref:RidA family protein n=1 Tax=Mesorhizobium shangrilense TaxID=460060 RepID=A0ABV2DS44_9HYPH